MKTHLSCICLPLFLNYPSWVIRLDSDTQKHVCLLVHLVTYRTFHNRITGQLWVLEKSSTAFPGMSLTKPACLEMRRVSGEEGKKGQGQKISQTLTRRLLTQFISIVTPLSVNTMSAIDLAKVTECIWCSLGLETRPWQDNHNTWWMILDVTQNLNAFLP